MSEYIFTLPLVVDICRAPAGALQISFQDAMVKHGFIEEDNVNVIVSASEKYCGIDRKNPRIEARIQIVNV